MFGAPGAATWSHPPVMLCSMSPSPVAYRFSQIARAVAAAARAEGLLVPTFVSPPRLPGVDRTIRRRPGGAIVAVRTRNRPPQLVLSDCVEGVVVANGLRGPDAVRTRTTLLAATLPPVAEAA